MKGDLHVIYNVTKGNLTINSITYLCTLLLIVSRGALPVM